jgi:catechol 2,3-dioxygenase-like lactoylglutathione lyase family enzyme
MVKHFDHLTIVVRDVDRAKAFFALLGFKEAMSVTLPPGTVCPCLPKSKIIAQTLK